MRIPTLLLAFFCAAPAAPAQFLQKGTFEERPSVTLSNDKMELTILTTGGALVHLTLKDDPGKMSPFWNPIRMAREIGNPNRFGTAMGHFVCVDGFGPVSAEEKAAGLPGHGEAHTRPWEVRHSAKEGNVAVLSFRSVLPIVHETFSRTFRMVDGENVIYVQSELENELGFDRPVCWAEHATIGSPFLQPGVTAVDMSARRAQTRPYEGDQGDLEHRLPSGKDFTWPTAPGVKHGKVDERVAPAEGGTGDHTTCLMDPSLKLVWVTAINPEKRLILGYIFHREEYPWTQNWENYPKTMKWARGLEFSTQPYDIPRREVVQDHSMFGAPTYRWLPAKSKIGSNFLIFYAQIPEGFRKVDDVRLENGQILVEDRKQKKQIRLAASLPL